MEIGELALGKKSFSGQANIGRFKKIYTDETSRKPSTQKEMLGIL